MLDLSYGNAVNSEMFRHLVRHGMAEADYDFLMRPRDRVLRSCIMGNDYYATNEHWVDGAAYSAAHPDAPDPFHYRESGEIFGYYVITHQYYDRYRLPVMHTETNHADRADGPDEARDWFQKQWANVLRLRQDGVPVIGFTWYGLVDWSGGTTSCATATWNRCRRACARSTAPSGRSGGATGSSSGRGVPCCGSPAWTGGQAQRRKRASGRVPDRRWRCGGRSGWQGTSRARTALFLGLPPSDLIRSVGDPPRLVGPTATLAVSDVPDDDG